MTRDLDKKRKKLDEMLRSFDSLVVCFSGGVDSTFLLAAAYEALGEGVLAVTASAPSFPERETAEARAFCRARDIRQRIFEFDELGIEEFASNPPDRCYFCKREMLRQIKGIAVDEGVEAIAEGSNTDDEGDYRPGARAVAEAGIISPLKEAGLGKAEIRELSERMGLSTWNRPSMACLASRFTYGEEITEDKLFMVGRAEEFLTEHGFDQVRVRLHGKMARIEVPASELRRFTEGTFRIELTERFKELGFSYVSLDLCGYRMGSMNEEMLDTGSVNVSQITAAGELSGSRDLEDEVR